MVKKLPFPHPTELHVNVQRDVLQQRLFSVIRFIQVITSLTCQVSAFNEVYTFTRPRSPST